MNNEKNEGSAPRPFPLAVPECSPRERGTGARVEQKAASARVDEQRKAVFGREPRPRFVFDEDGDGHGVTP